MSIKFARHASCNKLDSTVHIFKSERNTYNNIMRVFKEASPIGWNMPQTLPYVIGLYPKLTHRTEYTDTILAKDLLLRIFYNQINRRNYPEYTQTLHLYNLNEEICGYRDMIPQYHQLMKKLEYPISRTEIHNMFLRYIESIKKLSWCTSTYVHDINKPDMTSLSNKCITPNVLILNNNRGDNNDK